MTIPPSESADILYSRKLSELHTEIRRVRSAPRGPERARLLGRLVSAVREIELARDRPEQFTWRYYLPARPRMSWLRISVVVYCVAVAALATLMVLRLGNEELAVKFILSIALLGALAGIIFFGWTFGDWFDHRRRLRAALRLAERMQSGERLPRAESLGAPFVGPPAADLLVVVGVGIGALMSRSGLPREGAFVGLMSMLAFVVALAQRRKLQLALPFTNRRAKPFLLPMVAASMLLVFLAPRTGLEDLLRVGGLGFALTFYYMASVGLAEEAVMAKSDIIERDGRPVSYWLHIFLYVVSAFAAAGAVLLLPEFR